jgi:SAM-dependent methyltransferase
MPDEPEREVVANSYSDLWFAVFLESIQPAQSALEARFLAQQLPLPTFRTVLDVCCGEGRHVELMAGAGYSVTGIDLNESALEKASARVKGGAILLKWDMRRLIDLSAHCDAVLNLWQSFGQFDEQTNADILRQVRAILNPGGRFILDIYHRLFFEEHQGIREFQRQGVEIREQTTMHGSRLSVKLTYDRRASECFEWQLFTPQEISELARRCGLMPLLTCTNFDREQAASADSPRMQVVFERAGDD